MSELDALVNNTLDSMSEPSEHVINQADRESEPLSSDNGERSTGTPSQTIPDVDIDGKAFDPEQHATDANGTPKKTQAGRWAKKRGRKNGSTVGGPAGQKEAAETLKGSAHVQTGKAATSLLVTMGMMWSEEFQPIRDHANGIDERLMLESAFSDYFAAKDIDDIPPGVALTFAIVAYIGPRLTMPKTQSRTQRFGNWLGQKWLKRKNRKAARKAEKTANEEKARKANATKNDTAKEKEA